MNISFPFKNERSKIREIAECNGKYLYPIHWLHNQSYCECQIALWAQGVEQIITKKMLKGTEQHEQRESTFIPTTKKEVIKKSVDETIPYYCFRASLISIKEELFGIPDEIVIIAREKIIVIVDSKPGDRVFTSDKRQVKGYALTFIDHFQKELTTCWKDYKIKVALRNREKFTAYHDECEKKGLPCHPLKFIKYEDFFTPDDLEFVRDSVRRIDKIIKKEMEPQPTSNSNKCKRCTSNSQCTYKND